MNINLNDLITRIVVKLHRGVPVVRIFQGIYKGRSDKRSIFIEPPSEADLTSHSIEFPCKKAFFIPINEKFNRLSKLENGMTRGSFDSIETAFDEVRKFIRNSDNESEESQEIGQYDPQEYVMDPNFDPDSY